MGISNRRKSVIAGLVGVFGLGVAVLPSTAGSAPSPNGSFNGTVDPGWVSNGCADRNGTGNIQSPITVKVNPNGTGQLGAAKKIRVSFAGNILPSVVVNAASGWKYTYPAGAPVPCKRARALVTFQPLSNSGAPIGVKETDTLGLTLCASPCQIT